MSGFAPRQRLCVKYMGGLCTYPTGKCHFYHNTLPPLSHSNDFDRDASEYVTYVNGRAIVNLPHGARIVSIDVECVAASTHHDDRVVAQIALVDQNCKVLYSAVVVPDVPISSYLTPLTGLTAERMEKEGITFDAAMTELRKHLDLNTVIVGHGIGKDISWLKLVKGVDFLGAVDNSLLFVMPNMQRGYQFRVSQDDVAKAILKQDHRDCHDAAEDAALSVQIFNQYYANQHSYQQIHQYYTDILNLPRRLRFRDRHPFVDRCCMGNRKYCACPPDIPRLAKLNASTDVTNSEASVDEVAAKMTSLEI